MCSRYPPVTLSSMLAFHLAPCLLTWPDLLSFPTTMDENIQFPSILHITHQLEARIELE